MPLDKKRRLGRTIKEIKQDEQLTFSRSIEDKDLLLYLGLTDDNNPLFIQHDYASLTPYEKPIVPQVMLTGMLTGGISKILPGPGSYIRGQRLQFPKPVYHYATVKFNLEVTDVNTKDNFIKMSVKAYDEDGDLVVIGELEVVPPVKPKSLTHATFENFS